MTRSILDVLVALGAREVREGQLSLDLSLLSMDGGDVPSLFGGPLAGTAMLEVSSPEAFAFHRPPELAACGTLWLPGVEREEDLARAIIDAHDTIRSRLNDDLASLRRLGLTARLVAPEPRAVATVESGRHQVLVAVDDNGDLVVDRIDGRRVPPEHARVVALEEAAGSDVRAVVSDVVAELLRGNLLLSAEESDGDDEGIEVDVDESSIAGDDPWDGEDSVTRTAHSVKAPVRTQHLSDDQMAELAAALSDDDGEVEDDDLDDEEVLIDASEEGTAVNAVVEPRIRGGRDEDDEPDPTLSVPAMRKVPAVTASPSAQLSAGGIERDDEDGPSTVSIATARKPPSLLDMLSSEISDGDDAADAADGTAGSAAAVGPDLAPELDEDVVTSMSVRAPLHMGPSEEEAAAIAALVEMEDDDDAEPTVNAGLHRPPLPPASAKPPSRPPSRPPADPDGSDQIDQIPMPPPTMAAESRGISDDPTRAVSTGETGEAGDLDLDTAAGELRVDDFPALPADSAEADAGPTSVTKPGQLPLGGATASAAATVGISRVRRTSDDEVEAVAGGFDDGEGAALARRGRPVRTEDNGAPVVTAAIPTKATVSQPDEMPDGDPSLAASGEDDAASDVFDDDDGVRAPERPLAAEAGPAARPAPDDLDGSLADVFDDDDPAAALPVLTPGPHVSAEAATLPHDRGVLAAATTATTAQITPAPPARTGTPPPQQTFDRDAFGAFADDDDGAVKTRAVFLASAAAQVRALRADLDAASADGGPSRITGPNPPVGLSGSLDGPDTGPDVDAESLEARADTLEEEARVLRARAQAIRERRAAAVAEAAAQLAPPLITATSSRDGDQEPSLVSAASLPVLASMDVHEVAPAHASAMATLAAEESQPTPSASSHSLDVDLEVEEPEHPTRVPVIPGRASDEGVSLAAVQAALGELGVEEEPDDEGGLEALVAEATQIGEMREGQFTNIRSSSGDEVFESANASRASEEPPRGRRALLSEEAPPTRVREVDGVDDLRAAAAPPAEMSVAPDASHAENHPAFDMGDSGDDENALHVRHPGDPEAPDGERLTPGAIGLIVEDAKARDRLKRHLEPRFKHLVEAESALAAAALPELRELDALVFVRPRPDAQTREGIQNLCDTAGPGGTPRILVISSDERFDEIPSVLRRPLGQRASEVAQSVLDGLRELGVEALDVSAEGG